MLICWGGGFKHPTMESKTAHKMTCVRKNGVRGDWLQFAKCLNLRFFCISALSVATGSAFAATVSVNQTSDLVNGDTSSVSNLIASDGGDGISLREAIIATNNTTGADIINLGAGTHMLSIAGSGEDNAATGDLDITEDLTINGVGTSTTIVDGNLLDRVFDITAVVTVEISDLTVRDGVIDKPGGGIQNIGYLSLDDVDLLNNTGTDGGGVASLKDSSLTINGGQIRENSAENGGGVWIKDSDGSSLTDVTLSGNSATKLGGAIFNEASALTISGSTVNGNTAEEGGGAYFKKSDPVNITAATISGNDAVGDGGGIFNEGSSLSAINVTISGNSADSGAGLFQKDGTGTLQNITIIGNSGSSGAGGIDVNGGTISSRNTLIAGNSSPIPDDVDLRGPISSLGTNLIGVSAGGSGYIATDILDIAPSTGPLTNNGGSTQTHALLQGSRGINEGNNTGAPTIDQTGRARDAMVDIGAYEYPGTPSFTLDKVVDITNVSTPTTLTYTITVDNDGDVDLTTPTLVDDLTQDGVSMVLTTGPTLSGDSDSDGQIDTDEIWVYTATYDVTQANLDDGNDLVNAADFDTAETAAASDSASTTISTNPLLEVTKTADDTTDLLLGQVITYTYVVENTGNQTITNVWLDDIHNGSGPTPTPTNEALTTDSTPLGDSTDGGTNGIWDTIAPGDIVTFTATYTVTQSDVDTLQ